MTTTLPPAGISFGPSVPRNGDIFLYNVINISGGSFPEDLKKLLLNGAVHFNQDIHVENNVGNIGTEHTEHEQQVEGNVPAVVAEITPEPETHDNAASSSHAVLEESIVTIAETREEVVILEENGAKRIEILKSIIYGGLTESIASLGVVTSAASTNTGTGKIVALSLATLITGIFVFGYRLAELWTNEQQTGSDEKEAEVVDQYVELLGDRKNYCLHCSVAILSFFFFGLVPPVIYGFTFPKPENKDLRMLAVTGVSILCVTVLATMKAHIQKPKNCLEYFKIIGDHFVDGIGASVVTTIAGGIIEKYIKQSGWFGPNQIPTLFLPNMAAANRTWGSF